MLIWRISSVLLPEKDGFKAVSVSSGTHLFEANLQGSCLACICFQYIWLPRVAGEAWSFIATLIGKKERNGDETGGDFIDILRLR